MEKFFTYVEAGVGGLDVADDELPRLVDLLGVTHPALVAVVVVVLVLVDPVVVDQARVRHVPDRDPLAPRDHHVVDGQDRLRVIIVT